MSTSAVVTIGRQFGSGGREIGKKLADKLGIDFYDKDLIKEIAKQSGMCEKVLESYDEKPTDSLLYSIVADVYPSVMYTGPTIDQQINQANYDTIKRLGEKPCVIVGRCADYILRENPALVSVFIHANDDFRVKRVIDEYQISDQEARNMMVKMDKRRSSYYNFQADRKWGSATSYNLCIDSSLIGIDATVDLLESYIKSRGLL